MIRRFLCALLGLACPPKPVQPQCKIDEPHAGCEEYDPCWPYGPDVEGPSPKGDARLEWLEYHALNKSVG